MSSGAKRQAPPAVPPNELPPRGVDLELDAARRVCAGFRIDVTIATAGHLYAAVRVDAKCSLYSVVSTDLAEICEAVRRSLEVAQAAGST